MVSHDQHLIEATVDELWAVEEGRVSPFHGSFEDYKSKCALFLLRQEAKFSLQLPCFAPCGVCHACLLACSQLLRTVPAYEGTM